MAKNTSISLGLHFDKFITEQIVSGRFGSTSEVVRAGLRLLENDEIKLSALRKALDAGEASGLVDYDYLDLLAELDRKTDAK
jgi:antitoxin ParD1/3/4